MKAQRHLKQELPRVLKGINSEDNSRFAAGEKKEAILMCMQIIKQASLASEPFSTLAMKYEDQSGIETSL